MRPDVAEEDQARRNLRIFLNERMGGAKTQRETAPRRTINMESTRSGSDDGALPQPAPRDAHLQALKSAHRPRATRVMFL